MSNMKITQVTLKKEKPLIHCITNPISINQCANVVLSCGARPIMAEHPNEVGEITESADSLLLNLGNITDARMQSIIISHKVANNKGIPTIIDVVGVACSTLRRDFTINLLENNKVDVIKGNYSEIQALYCENYHSAGVDADSKLDVDSVVKSSIKLAKKYNAIILASGKIDIIVSREKVYYVSNGCSQLSSITGTGCMLGALCASYLAVRNDITSVVDACSFFGICGELSQTNEGSGTFGVRLLDNLSTKSYSDIFEYIKVEEKTIE